MGFGKGILLGDAPLETWKLKIFTIKNKTKKQCRFYSPVLSLPMDNGRLSCKKAHWPETEVVNKESKKCEASETILSFFRAQDIGHCHVL